MLDCLPLSPTLPPYCGLHLFGFLLGAGLVCGEGGEGNGDGRAQSQLFGVSGKCPGSSGIGRNLVEQCQADGAGCWARETKPAGPQLWVGSRERASLATPQVHRKD